MSLSGNHSFWDRAAEDCRQDLAQTEPGTKKHRLLLAAIECFEAHGKMEILDIASSDVTLDREKWREAIDDAKKRLEEHKVQGQKLRAALRAFEENLLADEPWPVSPSLNAILPA
jgi:hypothetical protein